MTTPLLNHFSNQKYLEKAIGVEKFSSLQTFFRIGFKNGLGSNRSYEKLVKHYGNEEQANEKIFEVCKNLMEYEMHLYRHFFHKKEVSTFMENFEAQFQIFGIKPSTLRSAETWHSVRQKITFPTVKFS